MKRAFLYTIILLYSSVMFCIETRYNSKKTHELQEFSNNSNDIRMGYIFTSDVTKIKKLVSEGANPNIKVATARGDTLLQLAVQYAHDHGSDFALFLLKHGANPNFKNNYESSAFHWAISHKKPNLVELFIQYGANIHEQNQFGYTPLLLSIEPDNLEVIRVLLENGAIMDIDVPASNGLKPLALARQKNYKEVIKLLEEYKSYKTYKKKIR